MSNPLSKESGSLEYTGRMSSGEGMSRSLRRLMPGGTGDEAGWVVFGLTVRTAARRCSPRGTSAPQVAQTRPPRLTPSHIRHRHTALI